VATTTIDRLLDYVVNTPPDGYSSAASVKTLERNIHKNKKHIRANSKTGGTDKKHVDSHS